MSFELHRDTEQLPEYVTSSIGSLDLRNIANRLRDMAAALAAEDMSEAAEHLIQAYGCLRAKMAAAGNAVQTEAKVAAVR